MIPYIVSCIVSLLFCYWGDKKNNIILHIFAIIPPIVLLTFRDLTVGTDTQRYTYMLSWVQNSRSFIGYIIATRIEFGFATIIHLLGTRNLPETYLFFLTSLLVIVPVYLGCIRLSKYVSPVLVLFLYYMMFYHYSFNILRQAIAMSFIFLAFTYVIENRLTKSLLFGIVALSFHYVSIVYIAINLLMLSYEKGIKTIIMTSLVCFALVSFFSFSFFDATVEQYESTYINASAGTFQASYTLEMILNFILIYSISVNCDDETEEQNNNENDEIADEIVKQKKLFIIISIFVLFLNLFSIVARQAFRLGLFLDILSLVSIPMVLSNVNYNGKQYKLILYILFAIFFWWFVFIHNHSGGTYPYTSVSLGIYS